MSNATKEKPPAQGSLAFFQATAREVKKLRAELDDALKHEADCDEALKHTRAFKRLESAKAGVVQTRAAWQEARDTLVEDLAK